MLQVISEFEMMTAMQLFASLFTKMVVLICKVKAVKDKTVNIVM
jgi:hypothetical protein